MTRTLPHKSTFDSYKGKLEQLLFYFSTIPSPDKMVKLNDKIITATKRI